MTSTFRMTRAKYVIFATSEPSVTVQFGLKQSVHFDHGDPAVLVSSIINDLNRTLSP